MSPRSGAAHAHDNLTVGYQRAPLLLKAVSNPELLLQDRRRTLQTVGEVSSQNSTSLEWNSTSTPPTGSNSINSHASTWNNISHTPRNRRSLPQSATFQQSGQARPTILITKAEEPSSERFLVASHDHKPKGGAQTPNNRAGTSNTSKPSHLSVRFSIRKKSSTDEQAPVLRDSSVPDTLRDEASSKHLSPDQASQRPLKGKAPVRMQDAMGRPVPYSETLRGRQEQERVRREQAVADAKARREQQSHGIAMGSSSTLPSLSPLPAVALRQNSIQTRNHLGQQQLLQNSRTMIDGRTTRQSDRRASRRKSDHTYVRNNVDARMLMRGSTASNPHLSSYRDPVSRSRSTSSNIPATSRAFAQNEQMPYASTRSPTRYSFPRPPSDALLQDRLSRSGLPIQPSVVRSSSAYSVSTIKTSGSNGTNNSRKSSPAPSSTRSGKSRRHQQGVTREHLDALAALTAPAPPPNGTMTTESLALLNSQQKKLDEKIRRASVASDRAARISQIQGNSRSGVGSRVSQHSFGTDTSRGYKISVNGYVDGVNSLNPTALEGLTPESVRLLREREKLLRWKAEREKAEFERKEREKIRERVRRANEMEEARSKELEKGQKKKKRGCCGWFGA